MVVMTKAVGAGSNQVTKKHFLHAEMKQSCPEMKHDMDAH